MPLDRISIRGARQHNLKNVSLDIPRDKLVVITGVSGSGKSSLAFDTVYAEGQRRYVESLSAYARQFLGQMDKPDVDYIEGLSPAVSIDQKSTSRNPRSTVATVTEIYDYLRLLYARVGIPHCPQCGKRIAQQSAEQMVDAVLALPEGTRLQVLAPVVRGRKGEYRKEIEDIRKQGFVRIRVDGEMHEVTDDLQLDRYKQHTLEVVVDRLVRREGIETRLAESIESALKLSGGILTVIAELEARESRDRGEEGSATPHSALRTPHSELTFSEHFACVDCGISLDEIAPRNFSFNSPYGACPDCHGLGTHTEFDPDLVLDPDKSMSGGGVIPFASTTSDYVNQILRSVARSSGNDENAPLGQWSEKGREVLLHGSPTPIHVTYTNHHGRRRSYNAQFEGVIGMLQRRHSETGSQMIREDLERYMSTRPCKACGGARLKPESLAVTVGERNVSEVTRFSVGKALAFLDGIHLTEREQTIGRQILKEIRTRLGFLKDVGLDYLTLDRAAATLAGGEAQRIRLATQIGSGLMGVLYILDEPSIGLHQRDNRRLIETLVRLRDLGNTILVVEHDEETIAAADWVIDIGPGAGELGGHVVAAGTPHEVSQNPESVTGMFLAGLARIEIPGERRKPNGKCLELRGARAHNLKNVDAQIPLGCFVAITGVSGSGKSTLLQETLYPSLVHKLHGTRSVWGPHDALLGAEHIDKVIDIDQSPIGRTPRSNPATYTGVFDLIRDLFAATPEAKVRGYKPGRFSFNVKGGRCESCKGDGIIKIEMHFLPDVYVPCEVCKGKRYNRETLEVRYRGKSISEVLDMTVAEACALFENIPPISRKLSTVRDVGLDYIRLGQPATTLSGGEAQRVKLAAELSKRSTGRTLYILDEPTTGLHFRDIQKLLEVLVRLVRTGNTVVVIEHNLDVIKTADWVIDMGPEGGDAGGRVVAVGTPEEVAQVEGSHTGQYLKKVLAQRSYLDPVDASRAGGEGSGVGVQGAGEQGAGGQASAKEGGTASPPAAANGKRQAPLPAVEDGTLVLAENGKKPGRGRTARKATTDRTAR
jgi:excinuclease ABC subunit A